jgi:hypothetical protein
MRFFKTLWKKTENLESAKGVEGVGADFHQRNRVPALSRRSYTAP